MVSYAKMSTKAWGKALCFDKAELTCCRASIALAGQIPTWQLGSAEAFGNIESC